MPSTSKLPGLTSEVSVKRLSTLEDGFSSRNSAVKDSLLMSANKLLRISEDGQEGGPKKLIDVAFEVKLTNTNSMKKNLLATTKSGKPMDVVSPLQTRIISSHHGQGFDQSYLDP
jgi:hypothetical protein